MSSAIKPLILIVDDTPQNIQVLGNILYEKGYNVTIAVSGNQALQSINFNPPDLILLDIQMPEMDGYEVCEKLKSNPTTKDIPIIFLTAKSETEDLLRGFEIGAVDYITKPFNVAELTARVATHIELKKSKERIEAEKEKVVAEKEKVEALNIKLHDVYTEIKNSIIYAKLIQEAVLPSQEHLNIILNDYFIFFKPRDIVSGDFYWASILKNYLIFAVADCTGHGVPGAFMSMLGNAFLNEIIDKGKEHDPAVILNTLRKHIITSLHQKGFSGEQQDGMDISLVRIDLIPDPIWIEDGVYKEVFQLTYSGANNPIWIIRKKKSGLKHADLNSRIVLRNSTADAELFELLPDKMPIGIYTKMDDFTDSVFHVTKGDIIYLFSDGYADQFGGPEDWKFMSLNLKNLLLKIYDKPMNEQKEILRNSFEEWTGNSAQTDDVTIMGIKIP